MTICIAALATWEGAVAVVGASDRMLSNRIMGSEPAISKVIPFTTHIVALYAGNPRFHASVAALVQAGLVGQANITTKYVADLYAFHYANERRARAEREHLTPLQLNAYSFMNQAQGIPAAVLADLVTQMQDHDMRSDAIVAGVDGTGAHIYGIENPGIVDCYDFEAYHSIGIGYLHADSEYMSTDYARNWSFARALYLAYAAKRRAEASSEVGRFTDLFFIGNTGFRFVDEQHLKQIKRIYDRAHTREESSRRKAWEKVERYVAAIQKQAEEAQTWEGGGGTGATDEKEFPESPSESEPPN